MRTGANGPNEKRRRFETLLRDSGDKIYSFALGLAGNEQDASDLVAEAWARALKQVDKVDETQIMHSYLFKIVQNLYIDRKRRLESRKTIYLEDAMAGSDDKRSGEERFSGLEPALDSELEREETQQEVRKALETVPEPFREALNLCDMMGLSYEEISTLLKVPVGTIRSRIFRGRTLFREAAKTYWAGGIDGQQ